MHTKIRIYDSMRCTSSFNYDFVFYHRLFLISFPFDVSGGLGFGILAFLGIYIYTMILIEKKLPTKTENSQIENSDSVHISAQNIDCGYSLEPPRQGGSNGYPQSIFLSRNKTKK